VIPNKKKLEEYFKAFPLLPKKILPHNFKIKQTKTKKSAINMKYLWYNDFVRHINSCGHVTYDDEVNGWNIQKSR